MTNTWLYRINNLIKFCFYALFFITPLVMFPATFELFEFNKMWFVFGISLIILFLWIAKSVLQGKITVAKTPLDIPIALFLLSQTLSTIFSLDSHVSWWGYYSRFNGGLLSTLTYIFLYYAFASNLVMKGGVTQLGDPQLARSDKLALAGGEERQDPDRKISYKIILVSLISGAVVALWGFPSHFGYDPTCLVFRGTLDVSCWTEAFQPKVRIFSTLGQPNWMAAYLSILIPISIAFLLNTKYKIQNTKVSSSWYLLFGTLAILFYIDLLLTRSQSGFLGFWVGNIIFLALVAYYFFRNSISNLFNNKIFQIFVGINITFLLITFFIGIPIPRLQPYTFNNLISKLTTPAQTPTKQQTPAAPAGAALEVGGTDSSKIRKVVWTGAIEIFKQNPLLGTGVETFAYAYYKVKPKEHNLTSEWDFLYNKAHNEYLNYLATTGALGLGSYLLLIGWFLATASKYLISNIYNLKSSDNKPNIIDNKYYIIPSALIGGYVTVLVSNFFGFSVVIINLFLFMIPILFFSLASHSSISSLTINFWKQDEKRISPAAMTAILLIGVVILYFEFLLFRFWVADQKYALGYNLDRMGEYIQGTEYLQKAVNTRPGEDLFKDEYSSNLSTLALLYAQQQLATQAAEFAKASKSLSDEVIAHHPNNVVYQKTRTRVLYALSQLDRSLYPLILQSIERAHTLAPTDAKIVYNMALIYDEAGEHEKARATMQQAIDLKPNYRDAYYGLALLYSQHAKDPTTASGQAQELKQKAIETLQYTLKNIDSRDKQATELLKSLEGK